MILVKESSKVMSHRYNISKRARILHKRREQKRKAKFEGLAAFAYTDCCYKGKRTLSRSMGSFH